MHIEVEVLTHTFIDICILACVHTYRRTHEESDLWSPEEVKDSHNINITFRIMYKPNLCKIMNERYLVEIGLGYHKCSDDKEDTIISSNPVTNP